LAQNMVAQLDASDYNSVFGIYPWCYLTITRHQWQ
jgi:hypothetical protein